MKTLRLNQLKKQYEFVCNEYVKKFANKQGVEFDGWVADEVGVVASFISQYFFNMTDIVLDINTKQKAGLILEWQSMSVEYNLLKSESERNFINYHSYIKGVRYMDLEKK